MIGLSQSQAVSPYYFFTYLILKAYHIYQLVIYQCFQELVYKGAQKMPSVKPKPQLIYISYQDIWYNPISAHYILYSHEKCQQFFRLLSIFFFSLHSFLHEMSFGKKGVSSWCYMACLFYHCGAEEAPFVMNEFIHEQCWGDVENLSHNISCIYIFLSIWHLPSMPLTSGCHQLTKCESWKGAIPQFRKRRFVLSKIPRTN